MYSAGNTHPGSETAEALIRAHYDDFNARQLDAAAARFHADARVENSAGQVARGADGFLLLAQEWLTAFPDVQLVVGSIRSRGAGMYDAEFEAHGTHSGTLAFGSWSFRPSRVRVRIPARELFQIEDGRIRLASVSFDLQDVIRQLAAVDTGKLLEHVGRIHQIGECLARENDPSRRRELIDRMGRQLDAARHIVRPYFRTNQ